MPTHSIRLDKEPNDHTCKVEKMKSRYPLNEHNHTLTIKVNTHTHKRHEDKLQRNDMSDAKIGVMRAL